MKVNKWKKRQGNNLKIEKKNGNIIVTNDSNQEAKIYATKIVKCENEHVNVTFKAKVINGSGALLKLINRKKECRMDIILNSEASSTETMKGFLLPVLVIKPYTTIEIENVEITTTLKPENTYNKFLGKKKGVINNT